MADRRFTEKQIAEVLRRASELQSEESGQGATEAELRAAAREVGIDPAALDLAINDLDAGTGRARHGFWRSHTLPELEFVGEGEFNDSLWEDTLEDLRNSFHEQGAVEQRTGVWEWSGQGGGMIATRMTVRQIGGAVRVTGWSRADGLIGVMAAVGWLPVLMVVGVLSKVPLAGGAKVALGIAAALAMILLIRAIYARSSRQAHTLLKQVVDRVKRRLDQPEHSLDKQMARPVGEGTKTLQSHT